jgi:hypothetical protein
VWVTILPGRGSIDIVIYDNGPGIPHTVAYEHALLSRHPTWRCFFETIDEEMSGPERDRRN